MAELLAPGPRRAVRRKVKLVRFNAESGVDADEAARAAAGADACSPLRSLSSISIGGMTTTPTVGTTAGRGGSIGGSPVTPAAPPDLDDPIDSVDPVQVNVHSPAGAPPRPCPETPTHADTADRARCERLVRQMDLVAMSGLTLEEQDVLTDIFMESYKTMRVEAGDTIVQAFEGGGTMYQVASGRVLLYSRNPEVNPTVFVGVGGCVEAAELFFQPPRERTVVADTDTEVLCWYRSSFRAALKAHSVLYEKLQAQMHAHIFGGIRSYIKHEVVMFAPLLEDPTTADRLLDEALQHVVYRMPPRGRILTPIGGWYYILRGSVVIKTTSGEELVGEGGHFGELSFFHDLPDTTVITVRSAAQLLFIPRRAFLAVLEKPVYAAAHTRLRTRAKHFYDKIVLFTMLWAVPFLSILPHAEALVFCTKLIADLSFRAMPDSTNIADAFPDGKSAVFVMKGTLREPKQAVSDGNNSRPGTATNRVEYSATFDLFSLLFVTPRALAVTVGDTEMYALNAADFQQALQTSPYAAQVRQTATAFYNDTVLANLLQSVPAFNTLPKPVILDLVLALRPEHFDKGERVLTPFDHDDKLVVLIRGCLSVTSSGLMTKGKRSVTLRDGAHFNDLCLTQPTPQDAEVVTEAESHVLTLSRRDYEAVMARHPPALHEKVEATQKVAYEHDVLLRVMSQTAIFAKCSEAGLAMLVSRLEMKTHEPQSFVVSQGTDCTLFILARGRLTLTKNGMEMGELTDGTHFAELSLCCPVPRIHSVIVDTQSVIFHLPKDALEDLSTADFNSIEAISQTEYQQNVLLDMLACSDLFGGTSEGFLQALLRALVPEYRDTDEKFVQEGQAFASIYFIMRGKAIVWEEGRAIHNLNDGNNFGGVGLFHNVPRRVAVVAKTPNTLAYVLRRGAYERIGKRFVSDHQVLKERTKAIFDSILAGMARKVPMFAESADHIIKSIVGALVRENFVAGDRVLSRGETLEKLYFAVRGSLLVSNEETGETETILEGGFWGDVVVLFDVPRHYVVDAISSEIEVHDELASPLPFNSFPTPKLQGGEGAGPESPLAAVSEMSPTTSSWTSPAHPAVSPMPAHASMPIEAHGSEEERPLGMSMRGGFGTGAGFQGSLRLAKEQPNDTRIYSLSREALMKIMSKYQLKGKWFSSPEMTELKKIKDTSRSQFENLVQDHFRAARFLTGVVQQKDPSFVRSVMALMRKKIYGAGEDVVRYLEGGDEMFYIAQGQVEVYNHVTKETSTLQDSHMFGEIALVFAGPRIYSITALIDTQLYWIRRSDFEEQVMPRHDTAVLYDLRLQNRVLVEMVKSVPAFAAMEGHPLREEFIKDLAGQGFGTRSLKRDEELIIPGDMINALFIVSRGKLEVTQLAEDGTVQTTLLHDGDHFGALTLLYDCPRTMSVKAVDDTSLHCCSREAFDNFVAENPNKFTPLRERMGAVGHDAVLEMFQSLLLSVSIFQGCRDDPDFMTCMKRLAAKLTTLDIGTRYDADLGEWVKGTAITDGEPGEEMLIVIRGELGLYRQNKRIGTIRDGKWYYEDALFFDHPRVLRVCAESNSSLLRLTKADFEAVASEFPTIYNTAKAAAWKVFRETTLCPLILEVPLFHGCDARDVLNDIAEVLEERTLPSGTVLSEKDDVSEHMVFVRRGCVNTISYAPGNRRVVSRARKTDWAFFGEAALLYNCERNCRAVTSSEQTTVFVLHRKDLLPILASSSEVGVHVHHMGDTRYRQSVRLNLISKVPVFATLENADFVSQMGFSMLTKKYDEGQYVCERGEKLNELYIVYDGTLQMTEPGKEEPKVTTLTAGHHVGVESLMFNTPRVYELKAVTQTTVLILHDQKFQDVLESNFPDLAGDIEQGLRTMLSSALARALWLNSPVFSALPEHAPCLTALAERMEPVDTSKNAPSLLTPGEKQPYAFVISRGEAVIVEGDEDPRIMTDSGCYGELNLFEWQCPRRAELVAEDGSLIFMLSKASYEEVMKEHPKEAAVLEAAARQNFKDTVLLRIFQGVQLFQQCYEDVELMNAFVQRLSQKVFTSRDVVVQENDGGNIMYIITCGRLLCSKDHKKHEITDGATFEEMALIYQTPRTVEYQALDETELFMLSKDDFAEVIAQYPTRTHGVKDIARDLFQKYVLHDLIRSVPIFARCRSPEMIAQVAQVLVAQQYKKGDTIIKQGEGGNEMYFISRGKLSVLVGTMKVFELTDGNYFGEIALLYDTPRTASVVADMDSDLFMLPNTQFQKVIAEYPAEAAWIKEIAASRFKKHVLQDIVKKVPIFKDSAHNEDFLSTVVTNLHPRGYNPGEVIVTEGEGGDEMFFVSRGELSILVGGNVVHTLRDGDFFGEIAIVYDTPRTATIVAHNKSQLFILTRAVLNDIMKLDGKLKDSITEIAEQRFRKHVLDGFLRKVHLFAKAGQGFIEDLTARLVIKNYRAGESVIREASGGNEMYFIARGLLDVEVGRINVAQLRDGDFFGEVALFYDTPRTASIVARQQSNLLLLHREDLFEVLQAYPNEATDIQSQALQRYQQFLLNYMLKKVPLFKNITDEEFLVKLVSSLHSKMIDVEEYVVREGEGGDEMYFVSRGRLAIKAPSGQTIHTLRDGDFFGEISLIYNTPRTASIVATVQSQLFTLNRADFSRVMSQYHRPAEEIKAIAKDRFQQLVLHDLVKNLPLLKKCNNQQFILEVVKRLLPRGYEAGQDIVSEGEGGAEMYFILRGHVHVCIEGKVVHRMKDGEYFGEVALIYNTPRTATITTASPCLVLELKQRDFKKILLDFEELTQDITGLARQRLNDFVLQHLVKKVPIFSAHAGDGLDIFIRELVTYLEPRGYDVDECVVKEGEGGEEMYFISQGTLRVDVGGTKVGTLKDGDFFGEIVLIYDTPRTANIVPESRAQLFVLQKDDFMHVMDRHPKIAADIRVIAKKRMEQFVLRTLVRGVPFFRDCQTPEFVDAIVACLYPRKVLKGTKLIREGTTGGDEMYFISRGSLAVYIGGVKMKILKDGDLFGEIALLYDTPRTATILAQSRANIYSLARESFRKVLAAFPEEAVRIDLIARERFKNILKDVLCKNPMFRDRSAPFMTAIVERLVPKTYPKGAVVVSEGEGGDKMFFVTRGELEIYVGGGEKKVAELRDFGYFGEVALVYDTPRTATIISQSETSLVSLSRSDLWSVVNRFPADSKPIMDIAEQRLRDSILLDLIKRVPLFRGQDIDEAILRDLVLCLDPKGCLAGEKVVHEGEGGDEMYFISQGHLIVSVQGQVVGEMTDGDFFGEIALLYDTPRTATIHANTKTQVFVLKRNDFDSTIVKFPKAHDAVKAVAKERFQTGVLMPFVKRIPIFRESSDELIKDIVGALMPRTAAVGEIMIQQGEIGDRMYFVNQGRAEVIANGEAVHEMTDGDFFGEIALVLNTPRTATVIAKQITQLFVLTAQDFEKVRTKHTTESAAISSTANARFKKIARISRLVSATPPPQRQQRLGSADKGGGLIPALGNLRGGNASPPQPGLERGPGSLRKLRSTMSPRGLRNGLSSPRSFAQRHNALPKLPSSPNQSDTKTLSPFADRPGSPVSSPRRVGMRGGLRNLHSSLANVDIESETPLPRADLNSPSGPPMKRDDTDITSTDSFAFGTRKVSKGEDHSDSDAASFSSGYN